MIKLYSILLLILFTSCLEKDEESRMNQSNIPHKLETGWYLLNTKQVKFSRKLYKSDNKFELESKPIVNAKHMIYMEKYKSNYGDIALGIQLNKKGTEIWKNATTYAYQRSIKFGLIIDDTLVYVADVRSPILNGQTALNRGDLSLQELQKFEKKIKIAQIK